jgi:DNA-binding transcriptional ArsR family regulator
MPVEVSPRHTGVMATVIASGGDVDIAAVAALFADRTRARVLVALSDGRALPASVLATEAGVSPQAASAQLSRLQAAGLLAVEQSGRHRYYRLATGQVSAILEALAQLAPAQPVRSLRQSTRAAALRSARACYDHLAGKLGVELTQALIDQRALAPTDGIPDTRRRSGDRLSSQLTDHPWVLGPSAREVFGGLGVSPDRLAAARPSRRPLLRFCLDWSEQRHHLAGQLGADVLAALLDAGWVTRARGQRAIQLTPGGRQALSARLGLDVQA